MIKPEHCSQTKAPKYTAREWFQKQSSQELAITMCCIYAKAVILARSRKLALHNSDPSPFGPIRIFPQRDTMKYVPRSCDVIAARHDVGASPQRAVVMVDG
jgi:hypothetical protein